MFQTGPFADADAVYVNSGVMRTRRQERPRTVCLHLHVPRLDSSGIQSTCTFMGEALIRRFSYISISF